MATQFSSFIQNENANVNAGKATHGGEKVKGSKNISKSKRKPLGDVSAYPKTRPPLPKEKNVPKKPSIANVESVLKSKHQDCSVEVKPKKCEGWDDEEIEQMHFPYAEQVAIDEELFEKRIDDDVDAIMSSFSKWREAEMLLDFMIVTGESKPAAMVDPCDHLKFEEEISLPDKAVKEYGEPELEELDCGWDAKIHFSLKEELDV